MKYYIDTEFLEGTQPKKLFGITIGETKPTVDLISIGITSDDDRDYYAICKEFNVEAAWNRIQTTSGKDEKPYYWIRENVLKPIFLEMVDIYSTSNKILTVRVMTIHDFTLSNFKYLLKLIGKTKKNNSQRNKRIYTKLQI